MKKHLILAGVLVCLLGLVLVDPTMAGPGGRIARATFNTFFGKVVLAVLTVLLLPFIIYVLAKEKMAERRARHDLRFVAQFSKDFDWLRLRERATDCFLRVHAAWRSEQMAEAHEWMSDWYWQNQQLVFLDRWQREGLVNVCNVKKTTHIKPLLFVHRNDDGRQHEGSTVILSITAYMQDYLARRDSGEVVEGSKKFKDVATIWSFTMIDGKWRVSNIEDSALSMTYAKMAAELPAIEQTMLQQPVSSV